MKKIITVAFAICLTAFLCYLAFFFIPEKTNKAPEIFCKSELLEISVNTSEKELLSNAVASDKEDGDLSGKIIIESISALSDDMLRTVRYAVADSSGNVSKASCKIKYTDYEKAKFSLDTIERYTSASQLKLTEHMKADDIIDGDLSGNVKLLTDITNAAPGAYPCKVSVSNSAGDVSTVTVYVQILSSSTNLPTINLTEYVTYINQGDKIDLDKMILSVDSAVPSGISSDGGIQYEIIPREKIDISGSVDTDTKGEYYICYSVSNSLGVIGKSYLTVVVR